MLDSSADALRASSGTHLPWRLAERWGYMTLRRDSGTVSEEPRVMELESMHDGPLTTVANHAFCELGGEAVVLNLDTGVYYGLDPVGTRVWRLLQQPRTVGELRDIIVDEFDVVPDRCEADLRPFLASLESHGLLSSCDAVAR